MGVGSDKVVDMGFIEAGLDERSAPSAAGDNLLRASPSTGFTKRQQALTRAYENGGDCCSHGPVGRLLQEL